MSPGLANEAVTAKGLGKPCQSPITIPRPDVRRIAAVELIVSGDVIGAKIGQ